MRPVAVINGNEINKLDYFFCQEAGWCPVTEESRGVVKGGSSTGLLCSHLLISYSSYVAPLLINKIN